MSKKCSGCGIVLQTTDVNSEGYIPFDKYDDSFYCQRCFRLIHYGKPTNEKPKQNVIKTINEKPLFVIYLIDYLNINAVTMDYYKSIKCKKLLVISKSDLIPESIYLAKFKKYLIENYQIDNNILFINSTSLRGPKKLMTYLYKESIHEAYIAGMTNSGKSSLINRLIQEYESKAKKIATSYTYNTTLDFIPVVINENLKLIDTPGIEASVYPNAENFNKINKPIDPITYQMKAKEALKIDKMIISFNKPTSVTLYFSNKVVSSKYYKDETMDYSIDMENNSDLVIFGLGFINIKVDNILNIKGLPKELFEIRKSMLGKNYE